MDDLPTLRAGPLLLEPLTVVHAEAMFEVLADPQSYRYLDVAVPPSLEHLRGVYARLQTRRSSDGRQRWLNWIVRLTVGERAHLHPHLYEDSAWQAEPRSERS